MNGEIMNYRIGVVSSLLGLSPEGLRLYEKRGILDTKRDNSSGNYRSYSHLDITALIRARTYHNYGFSIRNIERLINTNEVEEVISVYSSRQEALTKEIKHKQLLLEYLNSTLSLIESLPNQIGVIEKSIRPAMFRFEFIKEDKLFLKPEEYKRFKHWVDLTPFTFSAQRNSWSDLCNGHDVSISALGILEEYAHLFNIKADNLIEFFPSCPCLYTVVKIAGEDKKSTDYLNPLLSYIKANNIKVTGDPIARAFLSMNKRQGYTRYRQIWLPIED